MLYPLDNQPKNVVQESLIQGELTLDFLMRGEKQVDKIT
jgi:hypothetical protein